MVNEFEFEFAFVFDFEFDFDFEFIFVFPALCGALSGATRTLVHLVFKNLRGCINALDVMIFKLSEGIALYIA